MTSLYKYVIILSMNTITDEILKILPEANPLYSVLYIYALTKNEHQICPLSYAEKFNTTEEEVIKAFQYFQLKRFIHLKIEEKLYIEFIDSVKKGVEQETLILRFEPSEEKALYSPEEIAYYEEFPEVKTIFDMAENILGTLLNPLQQSVILSYYEDYRLDKATIKEVLTYAVSKNQTRADKLNDIAKNWQEIKKSGSSTNLKEILDAMGISKRDITQKITSKINEWLEIHTHEMVLEACDRTIMKFAKPNPVYTEGILKDWEKNGIKTIEQMRLYNDKQKKETKAPKSKFNNYSSNSVDYSKVVEKLQNNY